MNAREILIALHIKNNGDWDKTYKDIASKKQYNFEEHLKDVNIDSYITILDDDYPNELKHANKPLFVYDRGKDMVNYRYRFIERDKAIELCEKEFNKLSKTLNLQDLIITQDVLDMLQMVLEELKELKEGKCIIGCY